MDRYSEYKYSGVEWIGSIPNEWLNSKLKFSITDSFGGEVIDKSFWGEGTEILYTTSKKIHKSDYAGFDNKRRTTTNDLLLSRNGDGVVHIPPSGCIYTNVVQLIRIKDGVDRRFLWYSLTFQIKPLNSFSDGDFIVSLNKEQWFNLTTPLPQLTEQQQIVAFLDNKTAKIDDLVAKTISKIALLKEKRMALINQCVNKGLNPNAPMKDCGVEWIGEIPSHWEYIPTKYFTINDKGVQTGPFGTQLNTKDYVGSGVKVMNQKTLIDEDYDIGEEFISYEKYESLKVFEVIEGDIIMGTRGSFGTGKRTTFGKVSIVPSGLGDCVLHPCLIRIRLRENLMMKRYYYIYVNDSSYFLDDVKDTSNSTTIEVIYGVTLKDIKVPVPPINEQQQIVNYLDEKTSKIDATISKEEKRLELLKVYRQSLISNVVTGKIKVCN